MKIWYQGFAVLDDVPEYKGAIETYVRRVVRPDTEVVMHSSLPGTYPAGGFPDDACYSALYMLHGMQWVVHALKAQREQFDAFASPNLPNPHLRELRSLLDMPVVGYGEASFHFACMLGHRFGLTVLIDRMLPLYREQIEGYGLAGRCAGITPLDFRFHDIMRVLRGDDPTPVIESFKKSALGLIRDGADVIVPGEMPINLLLAMNGVTHIDGVPILDGLAITFKLAEMLVDLRRTVGLTQTRHGWGGKQPPPERVQQVLAFYGLDRLLEK